MSPTKIMMGSNLEKTKKGAGKKEGTTRRRKGDKKKEGVVFCGETT
jgi:hypothetical protein